jgi:parallel beta-helix repeat protein
MKNFRYGWLALGILGLVTFYLVGPSRVKEAKQLVSVEEAQADVTYQASSTTCNNIRNTPVNVPAGTADGDVMIMVINSKDIATQATPTGWTRLGAQLNNGFSLTTNIFYRVANSEPLSYSPITTNVSHCLGISSFSGVDNTTPVNAFSQRANSNSLMVMANPITPIIANSQIVFISGYANSVTLSNYSGSNPDFTERLDSNTTAGSRNSIALASGTESSIISTGMRTALAAGTSAVNNGYLIALTPLGGGTSNSKINLSGTCKKANGTTDCSDTGTIRVAFNGTLQPETQNIVAGTWSIANVAQPTLGATITVFIDETSSTESRAVSVSTYGGSGDITGIELIEGALSLGNNSNRSITNSNISLYDNSVSRNANIFYDVTGTDLIVDSNNSIANELLYIKSGNTFNPNGNITTASFKNNGSFGAGTNLVTFTAASGIQTISGNLNAGNAFYKVNFDTGSSGTASWIIQSAMKVSAANAADTFVIKNGTVTFGDSNGDNLEVDGKMVIAGTAGETGTFQTLPLASGSIVIDINNNASTPTCDSCIIWVGATSGAGQGNFKIAKNTILRLNPRASATPSDTGIEVQSTGYFEALGSQEATNTVTSLLQNSSDTTIYVAGTPWTTGQFDGMHVRFTSANAPSFGKVFPITSTAANTIHIGATTSPTDTNPDVIGSTKCSGNGTCFINVADNMFTTSRDQVGNYLHNISQDKYYLIATNTEDVVDSLGIISNSPDDFTTMNDGDDIEITEGIRPGDNFEVIDYASITAESGTACTSPINQPGEAYIWPKAGSETLIRYADICNMGRGVYGKLGLFFESVNGANSGEGLTINKSRVRKGLRGINLVNSSNNNSGKGISNSIIDSNLDIGIYFNSSNLNNVSSNRSSFNGMGMLMENNNNTNTISGNYLYHSTAHGIALMGSSGNKITNNTVYRNGTVYEDHQNIFLLNGSHNNIIDSNTSFDAITWGIVVAQGSSPEGSSNNDISNNVTHNNRKSGIVIERAYNTVFNNKSFNNGFHGLTVICPAMDDPTTLLFNNQFYLNDKVGLMVESGFDCLVNVINDSYGVLGKNSAADLYMGAAGAPVPGDHKMVLYNTSLGSPVETSFQEMVNNLDSYAISKKDDTTNGLTKIWGKYTVPANDPETPQNESSALFNYADNLWEKSASHHGYIGVGTEDTNLDYDLSSSNLVAGPYHYRATVKTAGNCPSAVFDVFRNGINVGTATCGSQFVDSTSQVKFKIDGGNSAAYTVGDSYTFNVWDASNDSGTQKNVTLMADKTTFTVPTTATLELKGQGPMLNVTKVTRGNTGGYQFVVNGNLNANSYQFDYLGGTGQTAGIILNNSANIVSLDNGSFNNFAVNNGADSFIQVDSALIGSGTPQKSISGINFENTGSNANCNLNASGSASGYWEFLLSSGSFSGEGSDCANGVADPSPGNFKWTP